MKHLKMDHLHFFATDLDDAIKFYKDLGCEIVQRFEHSGREAVQFKTHFGMIIDVSKSISSNFKDMTSLFLNPLVANNRNNACSFNVGNAE